MWHSRKNTLVLAFAAVAALAATDMRITADTPGADPAGERRPESVHARSRTTSSCRPAARGDRRARSTSTRTASRSGLRNAAAGIAACDPATGHDQARPDGHEIRREGQSRQRVRLRA